MICKNCGKDNVAESLYCVDCGRKLEAELDVEVVDQKDIKEFCSFCGTENTEKKLFCGNCGKSLVKGTQEQEVQEEKKESMLALILSIISICVSVLCCCIPFASQLASIVLAIISLVQTKNNKGQTNATVALALSIIAIVISVLVLVYWCYCVYLAIYHPEMLEQYNPNIQM